MFWPEWCVNFNDMLTETKHRQGSKLKCFHINTLYSALHIPVTTLDRSVLNKDTRKSI